MDQGKTVFAQLLQFVPFSHFEHLVDVYQANNGVRGISADAAERRDYRLFESLGQRLIVAALALYGDEDLGWGLKGLVLAIDSTTIDLCLSLFPWAHFRQTKAAVKAHVIMDLRGAIPVFISITTGKVHDVRLLNAISLPAGSILTPTPKSKLGYPERLRRVSFQDPETGKHLVFLTNLHDVPALTIAAIYKNRWQIELFFKWLKQNLAVKHLFGNSINAVKAQIWVAVCAYLLVLIAIRHHRLPVSPQIFLHLVETNIFEKITLDELVANAVLKEENQPTSNQLILQ